MLGSHPFGVKIRCLTKSSDSRVITVLGGVHVRQIANKQSVIGSKFDSTRPGFAVKETTEQFFHGFLVVLWSRIPNG